MHPAPTAPYKPKNHVRIVTAAALFDGHDAAINIMRRIIQSSGAEVIHLGHNRSAQEIVDCAIQEDAQAIAITSYQGGHNEYFKYIFDLLKERGAGHIKIFGGGGGVILPTEIAELQGYGITRIYSPDDGRAMGLQGMINNLLEQADFPTGQNLNGEAGHVKEKDARSIGRLISAAENFPEEFERVKSQLLVDSYQLSVADDNDQQKSLTTDNEQLTTKQAPILGITGQVALARGQAAHVHSRRVDGIHPNAVAEQRAAGLALAGVHGNNGNSLLREVHQKAPHQLIDER